MCLVGYLFLMVLRGKRGGRYAEATLLVDVFERVQVKLCLERHLDGTGAEGD